MTRSWFFVFFFQIEANIDVMVIVKRYCYVSGGCVLSVYQGNGYSFIGMTNSVRISIVLDMLTRLKIFKC